MWFMLVTVFGWSTNSNYVIIYKNKNKSNKYNEVKEYES